MRFALSLLVLPMLSLVGCAQNASEAPLVGGWSAGTATPQVQAAAAFAAAQLKLTNVTAIEHISHQVVAGMNYRFDMVLADGKRWRVTVWHKLDDSHELTASEQVAG